MIIETYETPESKVSEKAKELEPLDAKTTKFSEKAWTESKKDAVRPASKANITIEE